LASASATQRPHRCPANSRTFHVLEILQTQLRAIPGGVGTPILYSSGVCSHGWQPCTDGHVPTQPSSWDVDKPGGVLRPQKGPDPTAVTRLRSEAPSNISSSLQLCTAYSNLTINAEKHKKFRVHLSIVLDLLAPDPLPRLRP